MDRLGEAEAHAEAIVRLTESEAFLEGRIYARETASTLGRLHGFAWWSAGRLTEHLAITRKAIEEATPQLTRASGPCASARSVASARRKRTAAENVRWTLRPASRRTGGR